MAPSHRWPSRMDCVGGDRAIHNTHSDCSSCSRALTLETLRVIPTTDMADCQAQLRIVMYLYRGLLANDIIQKGEMPLLDILYGAFNDCKTLW